MAAETDIVNKILTKAGNPSLLSDMEAKLSMSELNSLLLKLFRLKTQSLKPADLLRQYALNRFVLPSDIDPVLSRRYSADLLEAAGKYGYMALELSPVSILGSCSVMAQVDQNKVLSALRGTEVMPDATNALALHICARKKKEGTVTERLRYCAIHRHIRTQKFQGPNQLTHFNLYCMVISGRDEGNMKFEKEALSETFNFYQEFLSSQSFLENPRFIIWPRLNNEKIQNILEDITKNSSLDIRKEEAPSESAYYQELQFKIKATHKGKECEIGDGGFVDWPQKLLQNKKERMLISAIGLERLINMI